MTSILGTPPDLRQKLYNNDPWVEFIDLDLEEQNDRLTDLDTDCLVDRSVSSNCSPLSIGFRDDDSGRASCCDPDLPSDLEAQIPNQILSQEPLPLSPAAAEPSSMIESTTTGEPPLETQREALYTQVSEVRASGKVLLSPEGQTETEKPAEKDPEENLTAIKNKKDFKLLLVNADHRGYTSEINAGNMSPSSSTGNFNEFCQTGEDSVPSPSPGTYERPLPPAPVYTVVEGVDGQNSLLLTINSTPAPQLTISKTVPTQDGYLTPDLLGSITP